MLLVLAIYGCLALWAFFFLFIDRHFAVDTCLRESAPSKSIDIIVAARDEEKSIPALLESIHDGNYPLDLLEVIVVDDHSQDDTVRSIQDWKERHPGLSVQVSSLPETAQGKKAALKHGLQRSKAEWVFFTDADCVLQSDTLVQCLTSLHRMDKSILFGTVDYLQGKSFLSKLLHLENLNTMAVTSAFFGAGKGIMANAANMMVHRSKCEDYKESLDARHPGGDDVFFAQQQQENEVIYFNLPEAAVRTHAPNTLLELLQQRVRWASKTSDYPSALPKLVAAIVFATSAIQILCLVFALLMPELAFVLLSYIGLKWLLEYSYQSRWFRSMGTRLSAGHSFVLSMTYPFLVTIVGLASLSRQSFSWKKRTYRSSGGEYRSVS